MSRVARHGLKPTATHTPGPWYCAWCGRRKRGKRLKCKCGQRGGWLRNWVTKPMEVSA